MNFNLRRANTFVLRGGEDKITGVDLKERCDKIVNFIIQRREGLATYLDLVEEELLLSGTRCIENTNILFFVTGKNVEKEVLLNAAKSVKNCTATVPMQSLGWMPRGYSMMNHYEIADTVMEYWVLDNVAMSWTYSAEPLGLPAGAGIATEIKGNKATYWDAEEAFELGSSVITVDGQSISVGGGVSSFTVPSPGNLNTLAWQDGDTGIHYRLQSILDMDTMIRIAENVK